jgi:hypothetical protein
MAKKGFRKVEKFGPQNKGKVIGKVGHTRTGACTSRGKCYHGKRQG